jgi:hypothetical protein
MNKQHEYALDVKLNGAVRVKADSRERDAALIEQVTL